MRRPVPTKRVDPIDMDVVRRSVRIIHPIGKYYFRSEVRGLERVPDAQTLLVSHHDGGVLPLNGILLGEAWHRHFEYRRGLYVLSHDLFQMFGKKFTKLLTDSGMIPADREHMNAALTRGESVFVMPGAARESFRPFWKRDDIDLGGRTGFVAQAIRWGLPITPVVSAGSHETLVVLARGSSFAKAIGLPRLVRSADIWPVLAGFPWGVWALPFLPQVPLPAKITVEVLPPIDLSAELGRTLAPADAEDPAVVQAGFDVVLGKMKPAVKRLYAERKWPVLG
jgi:1-acyl-sn-glycerol-3-phosphate acyltransferase